ncbi:KH homology domain-containing protein 4-like isoform X2 [Conger conger]|uniref:KH homology domain-containing protein 4-like isoform X2 n=1 Tax=Conger conger TaxID=82655 RepID=UPI002A5A9FBC|nr:KH homology domain-containing protein 4-like isoform X2 [Conger conger]
MASGMTGQTSCLNSRWDQASPRVERLSGFLGSHSGPVPVVSLAGYTGDLGSVATVTANSSVPSNTTTVTSSAMPVAGAAPPSEDASAPQGGVELAAAMAAKINAMLMAKGKLKTPPPLPNKIVHTVTVSSTADELVVTEVDINDVPINCRNLLTKGKTQEEIRRYSGAVVSTKGFYMSGAEKTQAKGVDRPLYLHVQGKSQEEVNKAVLRIKEMISEDLLRSQPGQPRPPIPTLTVYPQPPRSSALPQASCPPALPLRLPPPAPSAPPSQRPSAPYGSHSGNFVHTKIFVGLDQALPSFNVNEKVEGPGGSYLQHIQSETGARVFLRGKSSGYIEQASRRESFEPLYLYISHPNSTGLEAAKKLCESLLETVRAEHTQMVSVYTATGSTQAYPAHGYPANSNYSSPVSWYNYPNGYPGGYSAYPGSSGYWSNANGHPSLSNISTTPQSSQAMVQYPVCPRKPPPYLAQGTGTSYTPTNDCSSPSASPPGSPKRRFLDSEESPEAPDCESVPASPEPSISPPLPCPEDSTAERCPSCLYLLLFHALPAEGVMFASSIDADAPASCPLNRRRATQEAEGSGGSHQRFRGFRCG